MTSLLYGNCVQMKQQNGHCRLSSSCRPKSLLPNRERHVVRSEPRSFSSHPSSRPAVQQPDVYYEVFTRPIVLSRRHGCATSSVDQRLALQSLSDSNVVASAKSCMSRRTDRLKPELSNGDARLDRNICLPSVVGSVTSKNYNGAVASNVPLSHEETACHQADRHYRNDEAIRLGSRRETKSATVIRRNSNSGLTHIPSDTTGHSEIGHDNTCHSQSRTRVGRSVHANGSRPHFSTSDDDRVFLEKMTSKFYKQLRKTGNGRTSGAIRHRKIAHGAGSGSTDSLRTAGLCLVGQSFITVKESKRSPASENSKQKKNAISIPTSADCCSEVNGVSQQSLRQTHLRRLQVVISDHHQTPAAAAAAAAAADDDDDDNDDDVDGDDDYRMAHSDKGNFLFQPCALDVPEDCASGKIPI